MGSDHISRAVSELGWAGIRNGELLARSAGQFDVFVTVDRNLAFQHSDRRELNLTPFLFMVVSDHVTYADVFAVLEPISGRLGRTINPTVYTTKDFVKRRKQGNAFLTRVIAQPKVWVIGGEDELPA